MRSFRCAIVAGVLSLSIGSSAWAKPGAADGYFSQQISSLKGGGTLVITNLTMDIGDGSDVTNVLFGSTATTNILGQGKDWIAVVIPSTNAPGSVVIKTSSQSEGQLSVYSQNPGDNFFHYLIEAIEGYPLMLGVSSTHGGIKVYRKFGTNTVYTREYFGEFFSHLQLVNGTTTNRFSGVFNAVSHSMPDSETINFVMNAGNTGVRVTQVLRYVNGKNYFTKQWNIANTGATDYTDVRFIQGGDAYFANSDSACGYHNADLDMVYLKNTNAAGLMGFYGGHDSRSDRYFAGDLQTNFFGMAAYCLSNSVNTNFTDAGYSLQWNTNSLAAGTEWNITAYEKWTDAGDVQVIAASDLSGELHASVTGMFTVVNFQTNADVFGLSATVDQRGWTAGILGETNLALASGASSNVLVQVTVGTPVPCAVTLTAASQADPSVTNSDSLTVFGTAKLDQTIEGFTPTNGAAFLLSDKAGLSATASSGLAVGFTNTAGSPVSWLNATTITFTATGTVGIVAEQPGDDNYNAAPSITNTIYVTEKQQEKQDQTIDFPAIPLQNVTSVVALAATASSGLPVTFSVASGPGSISYSSTLTFSGTGVVAVVASQEGDADWNPAPPVTNRVVVLASGTSYVPGDFDGDGMTDMNVYYADPYRTLWYSMSADGLVLMWEQAWGGTPDGRMMRPVVGDYDGDGVGDLCMYDEQTGFWYILTLAGEALAWEMPLGGPGLIPVAGDYDGDGIWDLCVYGVADGLWYARTLAGETLFDGMAFGGAGFAPVSGDYDADGAHDLCLSYQDTLNYPYWVYWYGLNPMSEELIFWALPWGTAGWAPVGGDYDGDGAADLCAYDPETGAWYIVSGDGARAICWGEVCGGQGYVPAPGDYNGDGIWDLAVYHELTGTWYVRNIAGKWLIPGLRWGGPGFLPLQ